MKNNKCFLFLFCTFIVLSLLSCEDIPEAGSGKSSKPEYSGVFEVQTQLAQTVSNGALSYSLKATINFTIAWSAENNRWKISGKDQTAKGVVTLSGGGINCTGDLTGDVEIVGYIYPEKLKPCLIKMSIFQNWSNATLHCKATFPFPYNQDIPNGSVAFSISDDFNYTATSGNHSEQVSYTSGMLTGNLQIKMKSFNGSVIDGCGITY